MAAQLRKNLLVLRIMKCFGSRARVSSDVVCSLPFKVFKSENGSGFPMASKAFVEYVIEALQIFLSDLEKSPNLVFFLLYAC